MRMKTMGEKDFDQLLRKHFPAWLSRVMRFESIGQVELAEDIGVAQQTVSAWLTGKQTPKIKFFKRVLRFFDVDAADFWSEIERLDSEEETVSAL